MDDAELQAIEARWEHVELNDIRKRGVGWYTEQQGGPRVPMEVFHYLPIPHMEQDVFALLAEIRRLRALP